MIPVRLKIRNFMPYRGDMPSFSFEGIQTACICGDNGNGKSAIIDAMTWALWGKTRAKSDDDLIHLWETEATVEFDFRSGEQLYRVIRKRARPKKATGAGQSSLDLMIWNEEEFKTISGNVIRETENKIIDILHMDYDTFINSAFLRQGHADEFTRQQPSKRKEVLSSILGLDIYDRLEEKAREKTRGQQAERTLLERSIRDIEAELEGKAKLENEFEQAKINLAQIDKEVKEKQAEFDAVRQKKQALGNKKQQLQQLEEYIVTNNNHLNVRQNEIQQHEKQIKEYGDLLAQREEIEKGYADYISIKSQCDDFNSKLQQLNSLKDNHRILEQVIEKARSRLVNNQSVLKKTVEDLENKAQKLPQYRDKMAKIEEAKPRLEAKEKAFEGKKEKKQSLLATVQQLKGEQEKLNLEIGELDEKLNLLCKEGENKCPLCETALGSEGLKIIREKYGNDRKTRSELITNKDSEINTHLNEYKTIEKELADEENELKSNREWLQKSLGSLAQSIEDAREASGKLEEQRELLAETEKRLSAGEFAEDEQKELKSLDGKIASLNYDSEKHREASKRLTELQEFEAKKRRLEEAERLLSAEKEDLSKAVAASKELQKQVDNDSDKKKAVEKELEALPQLEIETEQAENILKTVSARQKEAQEASGSLKARLEHLKNQEKKKKEKEAQLATISKEVSIYSELAQAFGKKGIQMMLIETALPDIENEANELLGRMTDNRMHVKFDTQKPTKKGEVQETLEIIISDELGARPYETYSGGEAFRIDFAIRIALSKLLAKRAGAPLPTLIIDEGFGTLDNTGIEKIKEAINSIRNDFEKIIVITHIDELKDAFPSRINVTKTPNGSVIELN
ncbi:MAG: SMC family ATPase [Dehalococcoidales bacterium]|nr:SMC family ATPase [Dehalococcoidales bacterium]